MNLTLSCPPPLVSPLRLHREGWAVWPSWSENSSPWQPLGIRSVPPTPLQSPHHHPWVLSRVTFANLTFPASHNHLASVSVQEHPWAHARLGPMSLAPRASPPPPCWTSCHPQAWSRWTRRNPVRPWGWELAWGPLARASPAKRVKSPASCSRHSTSGKKRRS